MHTLNDRELVDDGRLPGGYIENKYAILVKLETCRQAYAD